MTRKKRGRPANEREATRDTLLAAAAAIFNADGYFATDTNKIARAAGFAPATFYRHFEDKKDIFLDAYEHWVGADWRMIEAAARAANGPLAIAHAITHAYIEHHAKWVQFRASMHGLAATDQGVRDVHRQSRAQQLKRLRVLLRDLGAPSRPPGDFLYHFLAIERAANAITDGELQTFGVTKKDIVERIECDLVYLLTGEAA